MKKKLLKKVTQKTIIIIAIFVVSISIIFPTKSQAVDVGGVLAKPLTSFALFLLDVLEGGLQYYFIGGPINTAVVTFSSDEYLTIEDQLKLSENASDKKVEDDVSDYQSWLSENWIGSDEKGWDYVVTKFSPAEIFTNKIPMFSINFIDPPETGNNQESIASALQGTISSWYKALRMLAFVGMLSILVYVGIRMILSSTAGDKAKYKNMIMDWIVALCLLFFLHYIMEFTIIVTDSITSMVSSVGGSDFEVVLKQGNDNADTKLGDTPYVTNLMGLTRFRAQNENLAPRLMYILIYAMLVAYTVIFAFTYLKRVLMMAFLTVISPIVVLTYPIDKISDGNAQGFNMWLKEYIFNALLQPVHCILYAVLVGSALELAVDNPFYAIAAMAFILPAEQLMRKFFNFSKASAGTVSGVEGFAGGLIANKFLGGFSNRMTSGNSGGNSGGNNGNSDGSSNGKLRMQNGPSIGSLFGGGDSQSSEGTQTATPRQMSSASVGAPTTAGLHNSKISDKKLAEWKANNNKNQSKGTGIITPAQARQNIENRKKREDYQHRIDDLQNVLDDPDTIPEDRAVYQEQIDYYKGKIDEMDNPLNSNGQEDLTPEQIEDYKMRRDNLQNAIDDPNTTPEDRTIYQDELDFYNSKLNDIDNNNDDIDLPVQSTPTMSEPIEEDKPVLMNSQQARQVSAQRQATVDGNGVMPSGTSVPSGTTASSSKGKKQIRGIKNVLTSPEMKEGLAKGAKTAARFTVGGGMALVAGGITLAASGGDLSKAATATAGAYAVGSGMTNKAINTGKSIVKSASNARDTLQYRYTEGAEGVQAAQKQLEEKQMAKQKKEFMKDSSNVQKAKEMAYNLQKDDYKQVLEDTYKLKTRGVEEKNIEKTLEVAYGKPGGEPGVGIDEAGAVAKEIQKYGTNVLLDEKKPKILEKRFAKDIMQKGSGNITEEQAKVKAKEVMKIFEKFL